MALTHPVLMHPQLISQELHFNQISDSFMF